MDMLMIVAVFAAAVLANWRVRVRARRVSYQLGYRNGHADGYRRGWLDGACGLPRAHQAPVRSWDNGGGRAARSPLPPADAGPRGRTGTDPGWVLGTYPPGYNSHLPSPPASG